VSDKVIQIDSKPGNFFDNLENLRIDQNFANLVGVEKIIARVPIRKPSKQEWVRVHPDEKFHMQMALLEDELENEFYALAPELVGSVTQELVFKKLYYSINREGVVFLFPAKLHDSTGRLDSWNSSRHKAAITAMEQWVRVVSNRSLGAYDIYISKTKLNDPTWPELSINEILEIAFEGRIITDMNHPILKTLRGEE
jgi:hypothetical protein